MTPQTDRDGCDPAFVAEIDETERAAPRFRDLERLPRPDLLATLLGGQQAAFDAVRTALPALGAAVEAATARLEASSVASTSTAGRLVYGGAGTSGRLAMLDGVELGPTFGWPRERIVFLVAGGAAAVSQALEGAEDDRDAGRAALTAAGVGGNDVVIALAASGRTPFTCELVERGRAAGALTIAIANNPGSPLLSLADHPILLQTGPEVLAGSTRMAAGTAQKIALNLLSTGLMVALGRVFRGRMVEMRPTNSKLRRRATQMIRDVTGCDEAEALNALSASEDRIREAILLIESRS